MSKTGIRLDNGRRELFLLLGDVVHPDFWVVMLAEDGVPFPFRLIKSSRTPQQIASEIRDALYMRCSSNWVDYEFAETEKIIVGLLEEILAFDRLISELKLPDDKMCAAFLDVSRGLRIEIKAALFRLLQRRRPAAAQLVLEGFRHVGEDTLDWAEPISTSKEE